MKNTDDLSSIAKGITTKSTLHYQNGAQTRTNEDTGRPTKKCIVNTAVYQIVTSQAKATLNSEKLNP